MCGFNLLLYLGWGASGCVRKTFPPSIPCLFSCPLLSCLLLWNEVMVAESYLGRLDRLKRGRNKTL